MSIIGLIILLLLIGFLIGGPHAGVSIAPPITSVLWILVVVLIALVLLNYIGIFGGHHRIDW